MITMRKINLNKDCRELFDLITASGGDILPAQASCLNEDEFKHWLTGQLNGFYHDFYVFENCQSENTICGFALSYDYRVYDRHCHIYFHFFTEMEPGLIQTFTKLLFQEYPLNKIFLETISTDNNLLSLAEEIGFKQEMCLNDYKYHNGNYEDWYVLSLYPDY